MTAAPSWWELWRDSFVPLVTAGAEFTIPLALISFVLGLALGFLTALARLYGPAPLAAAARFYVWVVRGTPLLVQLFLIFYGLPAVGIVLDAFPAALIGFSVNVGAYTSEILRAALASVHKGQWEAAFSLGLNWRQTLTRIILPQASVVATPPLANSFIALVKDTSLAAAITVTEMFQTAQRIAAANYEPLLLYTEAALIYLIFCSVLSAFQSRLERRLGKHLLPS